MGNTVHWGELSWFGGEPRPHLFTGTVEPNANGPCLGLTYCKPHGGGSVRPVASERAHTTHAAARVALLAYVKAERARYDRLFDEALASIN